MGYQTVKDYAYLMLAKSELREVIPPSCFDPDDSPAAKKFAEMIVHVRKAIEYIDFALLDE